MAWDINKDRDAIQDTINRVARRAQYYAKKGGNTDTENDFTYAKTVFVGDDLKPVKLSELEAQYGSKRLKDELAFLEEISQRNYIGSIRRNFKKAVLDMAEKMGYEEESKEYREIERMSPLKLTRKYKMGEINVYNSYKSAKASSMVALLEKK